MTNLTNKYNQQLLKPGISSGIILSFSHSGGCKLISTAPCWNMSNLIRTLRHTRPQNGIKSFVNIKLRPPSHLKDVP